MTLGEIFERIQETGFSRLIGESTWGYPIVGALHVLAMALFTGWMLLDLRPETVTQVRRQVRQWKATGFILATLTGLILFVSQPARYYGSTAFKIKLALIVLALVCGASRRLAAPFAWIALLLWAAVIVAARGIAFY